MPLNGIKINTNNYNPLRNSNTETEGKTVEEEKETTIQQIAENEVLPLNPELYNPLYMQTYFGLKIEK